MTVGGSGSVGDGAGIEVTDDQIRALTPAERRALIERLARPVAELPSVSTLERIRRLRLGLMVGGCAGLVPWIVILSVTLPKTYIAHHWALTWVGFDIVLAMLMATTAILGWQRRQLIILTGFATGVLLICDAWFDVTTASPDDVWLSVLSAVLVELPLAGILIFGTMRLVRLMANRMWSLPPDTSVWSLRIPI